MNFVRHQAMSPLIILNIIIIIDKSSSTMMMMIINIVIIIIFFIRPDYVENVAWVHESSSTRSRLSSTPAQSILINLLSLGNWGNTMTKMMVMPDFAGWTKVAWWKLFPFLRIRIWRISCLWRSRLVIRVEHLGFTVSILISVLKEIFVSWRNLTRVVWGRTKMFSVSRAGMHAATKTWWHWSRSVMAWSSWQYCVDEV